MNNVPRPHRRLGDFRFLACALLLAHTPAHAGLLDDLPDLQGKTVVYAGEFEQITCPIGGKYDCFAWPSDFFRTTRGRELCFVVRSYTRCSYSCRGIIAIGEDKRPFAFFIESISADFKKSEIESYKCPDRF